MFDDTTNNQPDEAEAELTLEEQLAATKAELDRANLLLAEKTENEDILRKSREKVRRLEVRMLSTKQTASEAKKAFETASSEHLELEEELDSPQARLPFAATLEPESEAEDWRTVTLASLALPDGECLPAAILEALGENVPPLRTMGDVADWSKGGKLLTDVKGIGETKAEKIDAALEYFWSQRPVDVNAELVAGVRETEATRAASNEFNSKNNWRYRPVAEMKLSSETAAILEREQVNRVGELVTRRNLGSLATALRGDFAWEVNDRLITFAYSLPENEGDYMREVLAAEETSKVKPSKPAPSPQPDGADAWRHILVVDLNLAERTLERLAEHDIVTVGELVTLRAKGDLDAILTGQVAMDVDDCLSRFSGSLPTAQAVDIARALDRSPRPIEPKRARAKRENATT